MLNGRKKLKEEIPSKDSRGLEQCMEEPMIPKWEMDEMDIQEIKMEVKIANWVEIHWKKDRTNIFWIKLKINNFE